MIKPAVKTVKPDYARGRQSSSESDSSDDDDFTSNRNKRHQRSPKYEDEDQDHDFTKFSEFREPLPPVKIEEDVNDPRLKRLRAARETIQESIKEGKYLVLQLHSVEISRFFFTSDFT